MNQDNPSSPTDPNATGPIVSPQDDMQGTPQGTPTFQQPIMPPAPPPTSPPMETPADVPVVSPPASTTFDPAGSFTPPPSAPASGLGGLDSFTPTAPAMPAMPPVPEPMPSTPQDVPQGAPAWSVPSQESGAVPTFTPPAPAPAPSSTTVPDFLSSINSSPPEPVPEPAPNVTPEMAPEPSETTPTDLSHLAGSPDGENGGAPSTPQPETLVVTPTTLPTDAQVVATAGSGFPKWVLIVGVVVLLATVGASAYFILGVGRSENSSLTTPPVEQPISAPTVIPTAPVEISPVVTPGSFGNLNGATPSGIINPSPTGMSALERLKQQTR